MPAKKNRSKSVKRPPEVWVSPDLMQKMKGADGHRGVPVPQSPYLVLADHFLGLLPHENISSRAALRPPAGHAGQRSKEVASREAAAVGSPPRAMAAAAAAGASAPGIFNSAAPRLAYPKPPSRPAPPHPPKFAAPGPRARPNVPKLHPPKPPKLSFSYRRREVDPAK